jgi:hypothetical protein
MYPAPTYERPDPTRPTQNCCPETRVTQEHQGKKKFKETNIKSKCHPVELTNATLYAEQRKRKEKK